MTTQEVKAAIRQSLGLPAKPEPQPTFPQEGHVSEFPYWSFSKKRSSVTRLDITYDDNSFMTLLAPLGMPSPSFAGYLDAILFFGQRDLFLREYVEISVYKILKTLEIDPENGRAYAHFHRDMERAFMAALKTDRFRNPRTGQRDTVSYFRILRRMELAKRRQGISQFYFDDLFLASLRSGYLKRLDFDFCLFLDKQGEALARFLYGHLLKRIGEKSIYQRSLIGFLMDIGFGYLTSEEPMRRNERLKRTVFPALDLLRGQAIRSYELDGRSNIFFLPKD
jgi:hypothetical protein